MGQGQSHLLTRARSCSVDDLQNADLSSTSKGNPSNQRCATNGQTHTIVDGQRYMSVDTESVGSSITASSEEEEGDSPPERGFTQSLPAEIERKISIGSKVTPGTMERDVDCQFSDNFVTSSGELNMVGVSVCMYTYMYHLHAHACVMHGQLCATGVANNFTCFCNPPETLSQRFG